MKLLDIVQEKFIKYKSESKLRENIQKQGIGMLRDVVIDQQKYIEELESTISYGNSSTPNFNAQSCLKKNYAAAPSVNLSKHVLKRSYTFKFHKSNRYIPKQNFQFMAPSQKVKYLQQTRIP